MFRVLAIASLLFAAPAVASDWGSAGGWEVTELDDGCAIGQEFEGPGESMLIIIQKVDDSTVYLSLSNLDWSSIKEDQKYPNLSYHINGNKYDGGSAIGTVSDARKGFLTTFGSDFLADFAASTYLHVYRDEMIVDRLSLSGSAAGLKLFRLCLASVQRKADAAAREKRRWQDLPKDPFRETKSDLIKI